MTKKRTRRTSERRQTTPPNRRTHTIRIPAVDGMRSIAVRSSRDASLVGEYWNAVHRHVARGDSAALEQFENVRITTVTGERVSLLTDVNTLDRLAAAGVLSFESIYGRRI